MPCSQHVEKEAVFLGLHMGLLLNFFLDGLNLKSEIVITLIIPLIYKHDRCVVFSSTTTGYETIVGHLAAEVLV